jgi:hypothetical protein
MANTATDPTGRSIVTQVAFKAAVEAATAGGSYSEAVFFEAFPVFKETLMTEVIAQQEAYFTEAIDAKAARIADGTYQSNGTAGGPGGEFDAASSFTNDLGATPVSGVTVKGTQHGPLPEWLGPMAAAKGVSQVWDNRVDRDGKSIVGTGSKKPHFKATDGDVPFWPPR